MSSESKEKKKLQLGVMISNITLLLNRPQYIKSVVEYNQRFKRKSNLT